MLTVGNGQNLITLLVEHLPDRCTSAAPGSERLEILAFCARSMCYDRFLTLVAPLLFLGPSSGLACACRNLCLIDPVATSQLDEIPRAFNSLRKRCGFFLAQFWAVCDASGRGCQSDVGPYIWLPSGVLPLQCLCTARQGLAMLLNI